MFLVLQVGFDTVHKVNTKVLGVVTQEEQKHI